MPGAVPSGRGHDPAGKVLHAPSLGGPRGPGRPLPHRAAMERLFGADLSPVRAWTGRRAELDAMGAVAAASCEHVAFADPDPDRATVAHEVAHVLQFRRLPPGSLRSLPRGGAARRGSAEREAASAAALAGAGVPVRVREPASAAVHCLAPGEEPARSGITEAVVPLTPLDPANEKYAKRVRSTIAQMAKSSEPITRNTAHRVLDGDITVKLVEDLAENPDPGKVLAAAGVPASDISRMLREGAVYDIPGANAPKYIPHAARNFYAQEIADTVFIRGSASRSEIQTGLEHESSHALNPDWSTPEQRFDTEARAYYAVELRDIGGTTDAQGRTGEVLRIALARENALRHYPDLMSRYQTDAAFKQYVDTWAPTGNLVNAPEPP